MKISNIRYINKRTAVITLEDDYYFPLRKEWIDTYGLKVDLDLDDDRFYMIINTHVKDMAKGYILDSLARSAKSKAKMIENMKGKEYPDDIIESTIAEYEELGYIDDYQYAKNYYELKVGSKSIYYIQNMLKSKGISDDIISRVMETADYSNEVKQIEKFLDSKLKGKKEISREEKSKIIASLFRKGYKTSNIYLTISQYLA